MWSDIVFFLPRSLVVVKWCLFCTGKVIEQAIKPETRDKNGVDVRPVFWSSIPVGDSDFSSSRARVMLNVSYFTFNYRAQNSPSSFTYHY